ncbi:MAG: hypothetical protein ACO215_06210, partial [Vulcanococcus sp.]
LGIMGGMFGGGGGKRIVDLQANSIHVLTVKNPAMIVAQMIQLNREIAAGNSQIMGEIAGQIKTSDSAAVVTTVNVQTPQSISQTVKTTAGVF